MDLPGGLPSSLVCPVGRGITESTQINAYHKAVSDLWCAWEAPVTYSPIRMGSARTLSVEPGVPSQPWRYSMKDAIRIGSAWGLSVEPGVPGYPPWLRNELRPLSRPSPWPFLAPPAVSDQRIMVVDMSWPLPLGSFWPLLGPPGLSPPPLRRP